MQLLTLGVVIDVGLISHTSNSMKRTRGIGAPVISSRHGIPQNNPAHGIGLGQNPGCRANANRVAKNESHQRHVELEKIGTQQ